jgi:MFS family permease
MIRRLSAGALITSVGNGAWYTSWAVFLTRSVGLSPAEVGIGMTLAGGAGILVATPLGHLADRLGPREVFGALQVARAAACLAYLGVDGRVGFAVVACLGGVAGASGGPRNALVCGLTSEEERMRVLGTIRSLNHLGWAAGAAVGALIIGIDSRPAYEGLLVLDAATFLAYAVAIAGVPRVAPVARVEGGPRPTVLRDRPYMSLAAMMGVLSLCWGMLSSGLPLWVALHTDAPRPVSAAIVLLNSLAIAAFQIRVSEGIRSPLGAARGALWAGSALAASCLVFALTDGMGGTEAVVLLLAGGVLHVAGELLFVAASWGLSIPLMPPNAAGQYQGMFATGEATAQMLAPALMTMLVAGWGQPGWIVLAAVFVLATVPAPPVTRWALAQRREPAAMTQS